MRTAVYVIAEEGTPFAKIGVADNPQRRLRELQTGNPRPLTLLHTEWFSDRRVAHSVERSLHKNFAREVATGEWFGADLLRVCRETASFSIFIRAGGQSDALPFDVTTTHWALCGDRYPGLRVQ